MLFVQKFSEKCQFWKKFHGRDFPSRLDPPVPSTGHFWAHLSWPFITIHKQLILSPVQLTLDDNKLPFWSSPKINDTTNMKVIFELPIFRSHLQTTILLVKDGNFCGLSSYTYAPLIEDLKKKLFQVLFRKVRG